MKGIRGGAFNLRLTPDSPQPVTTGFPMSMNEKDGVLRFEFSAVPSGSYVLTAMRSDEGHSLYARENVQVGNADVDGVALSFVPAFDVAGKVVFEGSPSGAFEGMRIRMAQPGPPHGGPVPLAPVNADGTFVIRDVPPETFDVTVNSPATSYLKSVHVGEKPQPGSAVDFTHGAAPLTLVLASDFADMVGTVKDEKGDPVPRARVTPISIGHNLDRMDISRSAITDEKGSFRLPKLPPGDYKIFAWDKVEAGAPQDPEFRKPYEKQGKEIRVASNDHRTLELTVVHVKASDDQ
jgi:hypothetical protein